MNNTIPEEELMKQIVAALKKIRYGAVEITVHNSHVVQIESREKFRFDHPPKGKV